MVTAVRAGRRGKRVNVYLDGRFAFSLEAELAVKKGLKAGQELSEDDTTALAGADLLQRCFNAATHYLSYRPRSEAELRERLKRRGFDEDSVEKTIARLREQGLVNDLAFAEFWKENRQSFSPRSRWLTRSELRQKGVAEDIIGQVLADVDEEDSAYRAAIAKARSLSPADYDGFRQRLSEYLKRRGFGYGAINNALKKVWAEMKE